MSALVEISEINGAGLVNFDGVTKTCFGTTDQHDMAPASFPVRAGNNTFEKIQRWHLISLGGSASIGSFRYYCTSSLPTGTSFKYNGDVNQTGYNGTRITAAVQPATTATRTPNTVPNTDPGSSNFGVGGNLSPGSLSAPGYTDFIAAQVRTTVSAANGGTPLQVIYQFDEVA